MKYYHVYSFIRPYKCPVTAQMYKTKPAAIKAFYRRRFSEVYDEVVLWIEDTDTQRATTLFTYNKPQEVTK